MIIIKNDQDRKECTSCLGNYTVELTKENIMALLIGETLGDPCFSEYGLFIKMDG